MLGFHSYIARPDGEDPNKQRSISHYELLTWLASAVAWKMNMGPIRLYINDRGYKLIEKLKIHWLYDAGIDTRLSNIVYPVDPVLFSYSFWAASKLWALQMCKESPCCAVDTDAIVWKAFPRKDNDVIYLHSEPDTAPCYVNNYKHYHEFMPKQFHDEKIWTPIVYNTAIMAHYDDAFREYYANQSISFMVDYATQTKFLQDESHPLGRMCFAEQRILPLCCEVMNKKAASIGMMWDCHLARNPYVSHLWGFKDIYPSNYDTQEFYCNYLIKYLRKYEPRLNEICDDVEKTMMATKELQHKQIIKQRAWWRKYSYKIKNIDGTVVVWEPNLPTYKVAKNNMIISPNEIIQCLKGSFDLYDEDGKLSQQFSKGGPEIDINSLNNNLLL